ncbi:type 2 DNA topoisomerase 6 subunit B-like [Tiliqua scincoides]|uniref:type 2 DNA topoisomerase 6 subunit B-like n=1 Tax=Tiliqua scincoides TaxID=71010 RepID=UPI0034637FA3
MGLQAPLLCEILEYLIVRLQYGKEEQLEGFTALRGTLVVSVYIEELVQLVNQSHCTTVIAAKGDFCHELLSDQTRREMESLLPFCQRKTLSGRVCPHESLHAVPFQISFKLHEKSDVLREDCLAMKQFIHRLSLVHPMITFHYCVKAKGSIAAKTYSTEKRDSTCLPDGTKLLNDGSHFVRKAVWSCDKIHPVTGDPVNLFIPDKVAERGFSGQLRLTPVASLCPCQKLFPNQPTRIPAIYIFVYDPAGLPIVFPTKEASCSFFEDPSHLALWERYGYQATLNSDPYWEEGTAKPDARYRLHASHKHNPDAQEQTLLLFLFLGYSDPFQDQPGYSFWDQRMILANLYPILQCSEQAVKGAIHTVVNQILEQHSREAQEQEKLAHSLPIMVDAISSIVSSSTNSEFRGRCLQSLQVADTQELQVTVKETISKVALKRWRASSVCDIRKDDDFWNQEVSNLSQWTS